MVHVRVIGDAHGKLCPPPKPKVRNYRDLFPASPYRAMRKQRRNYLNLIQGAAYSVQVGDLGFDYTALDDVDPVKHRVVAGNHDLLPQLTPHFLGDFGTHAFPLADGEFSFFFVRGAYSIDADRRVEGFDWWANEELEESQFAAVVAEFAAARPATVISHDCPAEIVSLVTTKSIQLQPSRTNRLLQMCWEAYRPDLWLSGHHHRNWRKTHQGTDFVCLGELGYMDFDEHGRMMYEGAR